MSEHAPLSDSATIPGFRFAWLLGGLLLGALALVVGASARDHSSRPQLESVRVRTVPVNGAFYPIPAQLSEGLELCRMNGKPLRAVSASAVSYPDADVMAVGLEDTGSHLLYQLTRIPEPAEGAAPLEDEDEFLLLRVAPESYLRTREKDS